MFRRQNAAIDLARQRANKVTWPLKKNILKRIKDPEPNKPKNLYFQAVSFPKKPDGDRMVRTAKGRTFVKTSESQNGYIKLKVYQEDVTVDIDNFDHSFDFLFEYTEAGVKNYRMSTWPLY